MKKVAELDRITIRRAHSKNQGLALAMTIMLMGLFFAVIIALSQVSRSNIRQADSHEDGFRAQIAAESGLSYLTQLIKQCQIPSGKSVSELPAELQESIGETLNNTGATSGASVSVNGNRVLIPNMTPNAAVAGNFSAEIICDDTQASPVVLLVTGRFGQTSRRVAMGFDLQSAGSPIFAYGIATNGPIWMNGSSIIKGVNKPSEANILTQTMDTDLVLTMNGSGSIQGDVYATNPMGRIHMNGWGSIGGSYNYSEHFHTGIEECELPEVDYQPLLDAVGTLTEVNKNTNTSGTREFSNIRIKAGSNVKFNGNTTLNGVIYIESPNKVTFNGGTKITGVVIGENSPGNNSILFNGGARIEGVENLPDINEFKKLRQLPGSSILASSFDVTFNGSSIVHGCVAVNTFRLNGSCDNTMQGGIICYSDETFRLNGSHIFRFDRKDSPDTPAGFTGGPSKLTPNAGTYYDYSTKPN